MSVLHSWLIHLAAQCDSGAKPERYRTGFALQDVQILNVRCGGDAWSCKGGEVGFTSEAHVGTCQRSFSARSGCHSLAWECGAAGTDRGVCRDGVSPGFGSLPRSPPWDILQGCNPVGNAWGGQGTPSAKGTVCV